MNVVMEKRKSLQGSELMDEMQQQEHILQESKIPRVGGNECSEVEEEDFGFSRNYFLAKELGSSRKRSARKLSEIDLIDEEVVITLAELLWDQLKLRRKTTSGSLSKSQQSFNTRSMDDLLAFLDKPDDLKDECFVCIVVHSIDGPGLRDSDSQQYLARVAACSHVRMVASIDHVNTPLFLAGHQMAHPDEEGKFDFPISFPFHVLSSSAFNHAFKLDTGYSSQGCQSDHELIKTRRNSDGQDCLYIPLSNEALQKLIAEII
ncbi:hypothetical protein RND71_009190 [Anisodus tanguticus]|uniref:Origin recognition complex subunit 2 n=1 Tax=Anisodus tanguticus TaxID=243964 RepID=A0AAE1VRL3_9SOLA|nr:hypothetical protein RND71_009190 [Anisodus tanguticus]